MTDSALTRARKSAAPSRRVQAFSLAKTLPQGQFTCPEDVIKKGPPAKRSFVGNKRNKNAELSQRGLEILETLDTE